MWTPPPEQRKIYFIAGGGLLLILITWLIFRPSGESDIDPDVAFIRDLSAKGDVAVIEEKAKSHPKPAVKQQLYRALGRQGPSARPAIERGMKSPDVSIRAGAYSAAPMVTPAQEATSVKDGLNDPEPAVRRAAAAALADMKSWGSLHDLLKMMADDPDETVRKAAVDAFEKIAYIRATGYKADDLPGQRATAIRNLKIFVDEPGRKEVYEKWLTEIGVNKVD